MAGKLERRIGERATNCIVIKNSEVAQFVDSAYEETKGEGAEKLRNQMSQLYCRLSRRIIQRNLNSMKQQQKVRPLFQNKAPLRPIKASRVQERHQVDLVSMISMPATIEGDTFDSRLTVRGQNFKTLLSFSRLLKETRKENRIGQALFIFWLLIEIFV